MTNVLFHSDCATLWTALGAIAQGFASILAIAALLYSVATFRVSLKASHYGELDRMYFDPLKTAMERPHVTNPDATRTDNQKLEYEIYTFMAGNFIEAVFDRCEQDAVLCSTWYPIVDTECRLHRKWLVDPKNRHKFKESFHKFIQSGAFAKKR